jgi:hypothetical protein
MIINNINTQIEKTLLHKVGFNVTDNLTNCVCTFTIVDEEFTREHTKVDEQTTLKFIKDTKAEIKELWKNKAYNSLSESHKTAIIDGDKEGKQYLV